jgi:flagellar FliJ protein
LDYREQQKKMAQEELVLSQMELLAIRNELMRIENEEEELLRFQQDNQRQNLDALTLFSIDNYRLFLQRSYQNNLNALHKQEADVEEKRNKVVERWRECKIMGKLKENALNDYYQEIKVQEQLSNDEISLFNYLRKKK